MIGGTSHLDAAAGPLDVPYGLAAWDGSRRTGNACSFGRSRGTPAVIVIEWLHSHQPLGAGDLPLEANAATATIPILVWTGATGGAASSVPELTARGIPVLATPFCVDHFLALLHLAVTHA